MSATGMIPSHIGQAIKSLWLDAGIQKVFQRGNEFNLMDNTQ
jgi:hypothetical protein